MRIQKTLTFDREERRVLEAVALSVPIAFGDPPDADKGWRAWPGRHLRVVAKAGAPLTPEQLAGALEAAQTLRCVLEEQSNRAYWEEALKPSPAGKPTAVLDREPVGLIAPGTDIAGVLAETRTDQRRQLNEALPILERAVLLCPIEPEED